jgi:hypothetical protein
MAPDEGFYPQAQNEKDALVERDPSPRFAARSDPLPQGERGTIAAKTQRFRSVPQTTPLATSASISLLE